METYELTGKIPPVPADVSHDSRQDSTQKMKESTAVPAQESHDSQHNESVEITQEEFNEMKKIVEAPHFENNENHDLQYVPPHSASDNAETRRKLIRKISSYVHIFKNECKDLDCKNLGKKSTYELQLLLEDVEFMVSTRRTLDKTRGVFVMGCIAGEEIGQMVGLKLKGFTQKIVNEPEILSTWDEISIKYDNAIITDPIHRLSLSLIMLAMATHKENAQNSPIQSVPHDSTQENQKEDKKLSKKAQALADKIAHDSQDS